MEDFLNRAQEINQETVDNRRWIHQNAESGLVLPKTTEFVKNYLEKIGLEPELIIESGVTANIVGGKKGKTILLRADMDALPMEENNDLPFKESSLFFEAIIMIFFLPTFFITSALICWFPLPNI